MSKRTTTPDPVAPRPADLVERRFKASTPNELWVADLTYVRTFSGWCYCAFVIANSKRCTAGLGVGG